MRDLAIILRPGLENIEVGTWYHSRLFDAPTQEIAHYSGFETTRQPQPWEPIPV
jgi:hypothetical protein